MTTGLGLALALAILPACDSDPAGIPQNGDNSAVLVGSVEQSSAGQVGALAVADESSAVLVTAGTLQADGSLEILGDAEVGSDGTYRIEGLPSHRAGLVVRAEAEGGTEVGRVIVHQETAVNAETRVAPINASTTLHAGVVAQVHGGNPDPASSAEIALRAIVGPAAAVGADVSVIANAVVAAEAAEAAVLAGRGTDVDADARAEIVLSAIAALESDLYMGADVETAHRAFAEAAITSMIEAGVDAASMASAQAAAATAIDAELEGSASEQAHLGVLRNSMHLNLHARSATEAESGGGVHGLGPVASETLADLNAGVSAAVSVAELRASVGQVRAGIEDEVLAVIMGNLSDLSLELRTAIEAELASTVARAELWAAIESEASAGEMAAAVTTWAIELEAQLDAWLDTLPNEVAAEIDASAALALFMAVGAGPAFAG